MHEMKIDKKKTSYPKEWAIFKATFGIYLLSVVWNVIHDCDETYNYWEPLHYLIHGHGCQTWEYSPQYGLRSYLYLWIVGWPALLFQLLGYDKRSQFYAVRCGIALFAALTQTYLYKVHKNKLGKPDRGFFAWLICMFSTGSFIASTSFLPSSTALHLSTLMLASWLDGRYWLAIGCVAASSLVAWPFSVLLGLPLAIDIVFRQRKLFYFIQTAVIFGIGLIAALLLVDSFYYGVWVLAPFNILRYNVLQTSEVGGSHLYGVEDWTYYVKNYFLNWNVASLLAIAGLVKSLTKWGQRDPQSLPVYKKEADIPLWLLFSPFVIWNVIFFAQPHKEERFLYPVYSFVALSAAVGFLFFMKVIRYILSHITSHGHFITKLLSGSVLAVFVILSLLRVLALILGYGGALRIYSTLHELPQQEQQSSRSLCLADEWHRFPSHFHLPPSWRLRYLKSSFSGQLPGFYHAELGSQATRIIPSNFNSMNREERSRYVDASECDYLIHKSSSFLQKWRGAEWETINSTWFLEVDHSPTFSRVFYIPKIFWTRNRFNGYVLYSRLR